MHKHRSTPPQRNKLIIVSCVAVTFAIAFFFLFFHGRYPQKILNKLSQTAIDQEKPRNTAIEGWENCLEQLRPESDIVFFGDSLTEHGSFNEYFPEKRVCNLGLSGDTLAGMIDRFEMINCVSPDIVVILGGINSLRDDSLFSSVQEFDTLLQQIASGCDARIFVISILPISAENDLSKYCSPDTIISFNQELQEITNRYNACYIDLYSLFATEDNHIKPELTTDGIHLSKSAYDIWAETIAPYIN